MAQQLSHAWDASIPYWSAWNWIPPLRPIQFPARAHHGRRQTHDSPGAAFPSPTVEIQAPLLWHLGSKPAIEGEGVCVHKCACVCVYVCCLSFCHCLSGE